MRILLAFLIGLFSLFFLSDFCKRVFGKPLHSVIGIFLIMAGFFIGFFGRHWLYQPLDLLFSLFLLGGGVGALAHHLLTRTYIISERIELNFVRKHETKFERALEILPGALTWIALTSPFWLSLTLPFAVAYLIIAADIYWLLSALRVAVLIVLGYRKLTWAKNQPWLEKLRADFPGKWEEYSNLLVLPTYKESLQVLSPVFDAIANSNYPKEKIFFAVGFEAWANPDQVAEIK